MTFEQLKQEVDNKFALFSTAMATYMVRAEEANISIQNKIKSFADDALGNANQAQADANTALAKTKGFTQIGGIQFDSGLIFSSIIKLLDVAFGNETAGISGIQGLLKDNPSYWSGGTYEQAMALISFLSKMSSGATPNPGEYAGLAKITMLHNGSAKIGDFIIYPNGRIVMVDPATGKDRLVFSAQNISLLADLLSETNLGGSVTADSTSVASPPSGTVVSYLSGALNVEKNSSVIEITGGAYFNLDGLINDSSVSITASLDLMRNDVKYQTLESSVLTYGVDGVPGTVKGHRVSGVPSGTYRLRLSITKLGAGSNSSAMVAIGSIPMSWSFQQSGVRHFQFGLDGMMAFFSENHIHFTETTGWDVRGKTNMPGVLLSGTILSGGGGENFWGAKQSGNPPVRNSTGRYTVYHTIGHNRYSVSVLPKTANRSCHIVSQSNTNFVVEFRTIGSSPALADTAFTIQVAGDNY